MSNTYDKNSTLADLDADSPICHMIMLFGVHENKNDRKEDVISVVTRHHKIGDGARATREAEIKKPSGTNMNHLRCL